MTKIEVINGLKEFPVAGHYLELLSTVNPVDVKTFAEDGRVLNDDRQVERGYFIDRANVEGFSRFEITTGAAESVKLLITDGTAGNRAAPADVTDRPARILGTVSGASALAQSLPGNVAVGVAEVAVLAAAARARIVFKSDPANSGLIYLGPVGIVVGTGAIELAPGDAWEEIPGASLVWRAISDTAAQTLRVQVFT